MENNVLTACLAKRFKYLDAPRSEMDFQNALFAPSMCGPADADGRRPNKAATVKISA